MLYQKSSIAGLKVEETVTTENIRATGGRDASWGKASIMRVQIGDIFKAKI